MSKRFALSCTLASFAAILVSTAAKAQAAPEDPQADAELTAAVPSAEAPTGTQPPPAVVHNPAPSTPTASAPTASAPSSVPAPGPAPTEKDSTPPVEVSGYVQVQYESHQDSQDQLRQGGALLNQNRFLVRRGRVQFERAWDRTSLLLEIDGNTTQGASFGIGRAEATIHTGKATQVNMPPLAALTAGIFRTPFGYELPESSRSRWFMERTAGSRALYPVETDLGVRLAGGIGFLRYAIALSNGEPPGQKSGYSLQDPNSRKDITARLGAYSQPRTGLSIAGGVSFVRGKGFHPGTSATKDSLGWRDLNENGNADPGEVYGIPGTAATPSSNFDRWAVAADLQVTLQTRLGKTLAQGEIFAGSNMDRGLFVADPILSNLDVREFGWHLAVVQELSPYAVVGLRYESYDPNADLLESRANKVLPSTQTIKTLSPIAGLVLPDRARLLLQYDRVLDFLARDSVGVPTDLKNNLWTLRLQVNL